MKKPSHIVAFLLFLISFIIIIIVPILSFFNILPSTQSVEYQRITESFELISEIFFLIFYLIFAIVLFILIPLFWYIIVNNCTLKEGFTSRLKLRLENIDMAFLWGIVAAIGVLIVSFLIVFILQFFGANISDLSNIPDIEQFFSPATMFFLIAIMPIAEEIYFRGFLLDKFSSYAGKNIGIVSTAVLFGIAHMSYGKIYPFLLPILMGIILAYIVIKTKNLYASIIAHIMFNVVVFVLYYLGKTLV
jgi:membrane protease YdiL (CAAX protease family)